LLRLNKDQLKKMGEESIYLAKKYDINFTLNNFVFGIEKLIHK